MYLEARLKYRFAMSSWSSFSYESPIASQILSLFGRKLSAFRWWVNALVWFFNISYAWKNLLNLLHYLQQLSTIKLFHTWPSPYQAL